MPIGLIKSVIYRFYSSAVAGLIALIVTGNAKIAMTIGGIEFVTKVFTYWMFDCAWRHFFGRRRPVRTIWLTGLSGSGKTTIARELIKELSRNQPATLIDGDELRQLFPNTGFDRASRETNVRRAGQLAAFLEAQGITPIVSMISPYEASRNEAIGFCKNVFQVYLKTPIGECERRDPKGLYAKARAGLITQFTGIDDPYEAPTNAELAIDTTDPTVDECVHMILDKL